MKLVNSKMMLILFIALALFLAACGSDDDEAADEAESDNGDLEVEVEVEETDAADNDDADADESEYEPEAINPDVDVCEVCAMAVGDDQFATQIVLQDHRSLKFDDIGCMYNWLDENGEDEVGEKFVRDYNSEEWILMEEAVYVFDEGIQTPMAYGMISFADEADAEGFIEEHGAGDVLSFTEIIEDHVWEMMKHDHGDMDHDHGDMDHDHGDMDHDDMDDHDMEDHDAEEDDN